uniref:Cytochrome c oxidase subunit 5A, mitochondrial n=1 Tax=Romanomermis culicivorax TaxID=13658 RepID=A0A915JHL3_ROMCU
MLRAFSSKLVSKSGKSLLNNASVSGVRFLHDDKVETPEEFNWRFINFFDNPEIDGWFIRKGLGELQREDVIPEPAIICAAFRACRRVNDLALAIRCMESIRVKCGPKRSEIWPYLMQECKSTMDELGIPTLEELGYDKPEFHRPDPDGWWPRSYSKMYNIRELTESPLIDRKAHYY